MVYNHAVANSKPPAPRASGYNLTARFMTGDNPLIAFRPFAQMLVINASDIRTADR
jgi:hypothetical protein